MGMGVNYAARALRYWSDQRLKDAIAEAQVLYQETQNEQDGLWLRTLYAEEGRRDEYRDEYFMNDGD